MKSNFVQLRGINIDDTLFTEDLVITRGKITLRDKKPSRKFKVCLDGYMPTSTLYSS
jgi:hypothetical protein